MMKFLDKIFRRNQATSQKGIEGIEKSLNCKFPKRFVQLLDSVKGTELILKLVDEDYRFLDSIVSIDYESIGDQESVILCSKEMDSRRELDNKKIKLPFARTLEGDRYKYLYFEGELGKECSEKIYVADIDSRTGQLEILKSLEFLVQKVVEDQRGTLIDLRSTTIDEMFEMAFLPESINYWDNSFGLSEKENSENIPNGLSIEQHAINYEFDNTDENIAKFEIHYMFARNQKILYTSSAYEIDNPELQNSIELNSNYRIFYHRYHCILDGLLKSMEIAEKRNFATSKEFKQLIKSDRLIQMTKQAFKSVDYRKV